MRHIDSHRRVTFREVLAIREFRALYLAQTLSVIGDQLARIAIGVMVFDRTGSSTLTGLSYAVSYLPWLIGGPTLSVLADHYPRRTVMIACDAGRCVFSGVLAIPGASTTRVIVLVALIALLQPPFTAARAATIPEIVGEAGSYTAASILTNTTMQLAVLAGFGAGGATIAVLGPRATILIDSLTFAISGLVIVRWVERRTPASIAPARWRLAMIEGWRVVFGDQTLKWLVTTSWVLVGTVISTEAISVPYARSHGDGAAVAGLLTASLPLGTAAGAIVLGRTSDGARAQTAMAGLAMLTPLVLGITALNPRPVLAAIVWFCAGAASAVTVQANRIFVVSVPRELRGRAFGIAAAGISGAQGVGTIAVGMVAGGTSPAASVGVVCVISFALIALMNAKRLGRMAVWRTPSCPESPANAAGYSQL
jgi:MFS family permease